MDDDIWDHDLKSRMYDIGGDDTEQNVEIVEMLTEELDESMAQMRVRAIGRIRETDTKVMLSIRYE